VTTSFGLW